MIITSNNDSSFDVSENLIEAANLLRTFDEYYNAALIEEESVNVEVETAKAKALMKKLEEIETSKSDKKELLKRQGLVAAISFISARLIKMIIDELKKRDIIADMKAMNSSHSVQTLIKSSAITALLGILLGGIFNRVKASIKRKDDNKKTMDLALAIVYKKQLNAILVKLPKNSKEYKMISEKLNSLETIVKAEKSKSSLKESMTVKDGIFTNEDILSLFEEAISDESIEIRNKIDAVEKEVISTFKSFKYRKNAATAADVTFNVVKYGAILDMLIRVIGIFSKLYSAISQSRPMSMKDIDSMFNNAFKDKTKFSMAMRSLLFLTGISVKLANDKLFNIISKVMRVNLFREIDKRSGKISASTVKTGSLNEINVQDLNTTILKLNEFESLLIEYKQQAHVDAESVKKIDDIIKGISKQRKSINSFINKVSDANKEANQKAEAIHSATPKKKMS